MIAVNGLNYGNNLVLGRVLGPTEYGSYAAFSALFLVVSLLPISLQQAGARFSAGGRTRLDSNARLAMVSSAGLGLVLLMSAQPTAQALRIEVGWLVALGLALPLYALLGTLRGEVQGRELVRSLGANMMLEHAGKILLTLACWLLIPGAGAAVAALVGSLVIASLGLRPHARAIKLERGRDLELERFVWPVMVGAIAQVAINNGDVLLAKVFMSPADAGVYAAVAMIGRIVFYGSWAVGAALFPAVAARSRHGQPHLPLLFVGIGVVAVVSAAISLGCAIDPAWVLEHLFGAAYLNGAGLLVLYALATSLYALANVIANHFLATGKRGFGYLPALGAAIQVGGILVFHGTAREIVICQVFAMGALLAFSIGYAMLCQSQPERKWYVIPGL